ncbi:putative Protein CLEC16A [Hypsibius exemplaris]|uniref:Protein CLEC16A n=1 Tax=Hypsibius exemplaris TaxID=2072580 RepID=A0A1W0X213_HYPEX|nr:putative Protein CLEC16A [Hypsibius exemplaris]
MFNSRWWSNSPKGATSPASKSPLPDSPKGEKLSPTHSQGGSGSAVLKEDVGKKDGRFSADRLRTLYAQLTNEPAVGDSNSAEIVAVLRNMSEILIWGDKNDPSVFECFLEKHMLANFVSILQQCGVVFTKHSGKEEAAQVPVKILKESSPITERSLFSGSSVTKTPSKRDTPVPEVLSVSAAHHVCTQVLQLLHILFENISQDTSLYFLLSNNFINQIIECSFDLSDDEILAHYVSLMKILSAKLNPHTIHFFHHEDRSRGREDRPDPDFPLFVRALGLFSFPETMVRIAARTVILNVFNVRDLDSSDRSFISSITLPQQLMRTLLDIMVKQAIKIRDFLHESGIADGFIDAGLYNQASLEEDQLTVRQKILTGWNERRKQGSALQDLIVEHMEYVQYISDLAGLRVEPLHARVRSDFEEHYILPLVLFPLRNNLDALRRTDDVFTRRRLVTEILFSLLLLNLVAINLTDISLLVSSIHADKIFTSLLDYLTVLDNREAVPQDDRFPIFVLMFFLTLSERRTQIQTDGINFDVFIAAKLLPAVVGIIHQVPVVGFTTCRVMVLRLACMWIESSVLQQPALVLDDHFLAVLLDAREQSCLSLRRFYKNDDAFIGLVELEVHLQHQLVKSPLKMERVLGHDLTAFLSLCPRRATWANSDMPGNSSDSGSRPSSAKTIAEERGFPDLYKRWPLTGDEKCRYYLRLFFLLRRLSNKMQKVSTPPGVVAVATGLPAEVVAGATAVTTTTSSSSSFDEMPAPFQSVQIGDVVDISSCDTILSCTVIPFHTHLAVRPQDKLSTLGSNSPKSRPLQLLLCPSDEEKWVKRFLIIHQWQMLFVEPDNRKLGFAVVKESFVLPSVQLLHEKEQRERIICCCAVAISTNHRTHDVNPTVGTETKMTLKSIFLQIQQQLPQQLAAAPNDAPWNMDPRYEAYARVIFDDSIRAMAASTRIRKNQERIRELKLGAINTLLDLPIGTSNQSDATDGSTNNENTPGTRVLPVPFVTSSPREKTDRVKSAGSRRAAPVVILHGSAGASSQLLSVDPSTKHRGKSGSRGPSRERPKSARSTAGMPIPLARLDTAARSGFIERVEPSSQDSHT